MSYLPPGVTDDDLDPVSVYLDSLNDLQRLALLPQNLKNIIAAGFDSMLQSVNIHFSCGITDPMSDKKLSDLIRDERQGMYDSYLEYVMKSKDTVTILRAVVFDKILASN